MTKVMAQRTNPNKRGDRTVLRRPPRAGLFPRKARHPAAIWLRICLLPRWSSRRAPRPLLTPSALPRRQCLRRGCSLATQRPTSPGISHSSSSPQRALQLREDTERADPRWKPSPLVPPTKRTPFRRRPALPRWRTACPRGSHGLAAGRGRHPRHTAARSRVGRRQERRLARVVTRSRRPAGSSCGRTRCAHPHPLPRRGAC